MREGVQVVGTSLPDEDTADDARVFARALGIRVIGYPTAARVIFDEFGSYGVLSGADAASFAPSRALALDGAAILFVAGSWPELALLRARATENRVFVVAATDTEGLILGPDGQILSRCASAEAQPAVATVDFNTACDKYVFPGTHIFEQRRPVVYEVALG
jgi:predicted amidohydrolase